MVELITLIARSLVDEPDSVKVSRLDEDDSVTIELTVASPDLGKVIGKQGRPVQAIRTVLGAAAGKSRKRYILEIVE